MISFIWRDIPVFTLFGFLVFLLLLRLLFVYTGACKMVNLWFLDGCFSFEFCFLGFVFVLLSLWILECLNWRLKVCENMVLGGMFSGMMNSYCEKERENSLLLKFLQLRCERSPTKIRLRLHHLLLAYGACLPNNLLETFVRFPFCLYCICQRRNQK